MTLDRKTVAKVATLARIELSEDQLDKYAPQLSNILHFVEQLDEVNTDDVEPLANVVDIDLRLRKDEVNDGDCHEAVMTNAPEELEGFYVVPKVVE